MCIFVCGFPHEIGGAGNECWWSAQLWKRYSLEDIHFIPTWTTSDSEWIVRVENAGFDIIDCPSSKELYSVPNLAGETVVSFCNNLAVSAFPTLRDLGCRIVYCPLMCNVRQSENAGYTQAFPDVIVFQSEYQRKRLEPQLSRFGYTPDKGIVIHGGVSWWDMKFRPRPHSSEEPFVIGRLARSVPSKWYLKLWKMYEQIPNRRAIIMGAGPNLTLGRTPEWATRLDAGALPSEMIYRQFHAYVTKNGEDEENWPAVGREAMSYGVPVVAEDAFGWREMIIHGETGYLGKTPDDIASYASLLSKDEALRIRIATKARERLECVLCNPEVLWSQWREVL